jgi:hypothetical protein
MKPKSNVEMMENIAEISNMDTKRFRTESTSLTGIPWCTTTIATAGGLQELEEVKEVSVSADAKFLTMIWLSNA